MESIIRKHHAVIYRISLCVLFLMMLFLTRLETVRIAPVAVAVVLLLSVGLAVFRRARLLVLPFFLLFVSLIFCNDSYTVFNRYLCL